MSKRRLAWMIWGVSVAVAVGAVIVDRIARGTDIGESFFAVLAVFLYSTVGALITSRQAGNRVGLLFAWVGLSASTSLLAGSYATFAQLNDLPLLPAAAWIGRVGFAAMCGPLACLFLIFPSGPPASRRGRFRVPARSLSGAGVPPTPPPAAGSGSEVGPLTSVTAAPRSRATSASA